MPPIKRTRDAFAKAIKPRSQEGETISRREANKLVKSSVKDIGKSSTPVATMNEVNRFLDAKYDADRDGGTQHMPVPTKSGWFARKTASEVLRDVETPMRKAALGRLAKLAGVSTSKDPVKLAQSIAAKGLERMNKRNPEKTRETFRALLEELRELRTTPAQNDQMWSINADFEARAIKLIPD